mgnify:CR=1 FL=1
MRNLFYTLQRLLEEERPEALCVTFDRREPTFRHLEYEGYKAQRTGMPEELAQQMPILKETLDSEPSRFSRRCPSRLGYCRWNRP